MTTAYKGIVWKAKVEGMGKSASQFDKAAKGAKNLDKSLGGIGGKFKKLETGFQKIGQAGGIMKSLAADLAKSGAIIIGVSAGILKLGSSLAGLYGQSQDVSAGFNNLAKSAGLDAAAALAVMQKETRGTVDSMFLMQQANNAMLLGLPVSIEFMAKLSKGAFLLSKAVGKDAAYGFESLVTGIGRQSRMMLDNLGIIVNADRAYKDYAATLGKSVDALSEQERKLAFTNASMKAIETRLAAVGELESTATDKLAKFNVGWIAFKRNIGKAIVESGALDEALGSLNSLFADFKAAIEKNPDLIPSIFRTATTVVATFAKQLPGLIGLIGTLVEHSKTLLTTWLTIKGAMAGAKLGSLIPIPGATVFGGLAGGGLAFAGARALTGKMDAAEAQIRASGQTNVTVNNQISPVFSINVDEVDGALASLAQTVKDETKKPLATLGNDFYRTRQDIRLADRYRSGSV